MFRPLGTILATALIASGLSGPAAAQTCGQDYTIVRGDTLSHISLASLGSVFAYPVIHERNLDIIGPNPDFILAGDTIYLPCKQAAGEGVDWTLLPEPETLATLRDITTVQILDIRPADQQAAGVIPGSISIPFSEWRGPKDNPGEPPSEERLSEILGQSGLRLDQPTVIIHSKADAFDHGRAALVYWILKSAGAEQLAMLRGGFDAWTATDMPVAATPASPRPYQASVTLSDNWRASLDDVKDISAGRGPGKLLDARPPSIFKRLSNLGEALPSTLPGAANLPAMEPYAIMRSEQQFEDGVASVLDYFKEQQIDWENETVVSFCNTGELAALNWFYASELAGIANVKVYPESTRGWVAQGEELVPVAN